MTGSSAPAMPAGHLRRRATGLLLGYVADRLLGDPQRFHPVAGFGQLAQQVESALWRDHRAVGAAYTVMLVGGAGTAAAAMQRVVRHHPALDVACHALMTWAVLGGRSLAEEAHLVQQLLAREDLSAARRRATHLVGRDTHNLTSADVARAAVESVAENTSDAVVAPLVAGAVAGLPGLVTYRAANTLDAMVGHLDPRHRRFGWASARLDDLFNLVPARLTAALAAGLAPSVGGRPADSWRTWRRDARGHPSPNAGPVEAAFAGALGIRIGGRTTYRERVEDRPVLGDSGPATIADVERAVRLADGVGRWSVLACAAGCLFTPILRPRRARSPHR